MDSDNTSGIERAYKYLRNLGHRKIAYISNQPGETSERYNAFRRILNEEETVITANRLLDNVSMGVDGRRKALETILEPEAPTAVICSSDELAIDFIHAMQDFGLKCPEDMSVIGFGKQPVRTLFDSPQLTTIAEKHETIAMEIHRMMQKQFNGGMECPRKVRVSVYLEIGGTATVPRTHRTGDQK